MVTEQIIEAAGRAGAAGVVPDPSLRSGPPSEAARLGAAAQLFAVKTNCPCSSCQALRKMADITMSAILEISLEAAAAAPVEVPTEAAPITEEAPADAPGDDPQP